MTIDFAFCINNKYAEYIKVPILSICKNHLTENIRIHILSDDISDPVKTKIINEIKDFQNVIVQFYEVNPAPLKGLKETWTLIAWYRILLPDLLQSVDKVLYLDADTVVTSNISELFKMDMTDSPIAAIVDVESFNPQTIARCELSDTEEYFCSGILLMNLKYWRENKIKDKVIQWGKENGQLIKFPDQDTMNILFKSDKIVLPIKYGLQPAFLNCQSIRKGKYKQQLLSACKQPGIIHYAGNAPWDRDHNRTPLHVFWIYYNKQLHQPIKLINETTGLQRIKVRIWQLIHPYSHKNAYSQLLKKLIEE